MSWSRDRKPLKSGACLSSFLFSVISPRQRSQCRPQVSTKCWKASSSGGLTHTLPAPSVELWKPCQPSADNPGFTAPGSIALQGLCRPEREGGITEKLQPPRERDQTPNTVQVLLMKQPSQASSEKPRRFTRVPGPLPHYKLCRELSWLGSWFWLWFAELLKPKTHFVI